jgi:hypothetical protein
LYSNPPDHRQKGGKQTKPKKITKDLVRIKKVIIFVKQIRNKKYKNTHRGIEQSVARQAHNLKVVGSSPAPATKEFSTENNVL